jgi:hypothetical protein
VKFLLRTFVKRYLNLNNWLTGVSSTEPDASIMKKTLHKYTGKLLTNVYTPPISITHSHPQKINNYANLAFNSGMVNFQPNTNYSPENLISTKTINVYTANT